MGPFCVIRQPYFDGLDKQSELLRTARLFSSEIVEKVIKNLSRDRQTRPGDPVGSKEPLWRAIGPPKKTHAVRFFPTETEVTWGDGILIFRGFLFLEESQDVHQISTRCPPDVYQMSTRYLSASFLSLGFFS